MRPWLFRILGGEWHRVEIDSDYKFRDVASLIGERLQVQAPTEIHLSKQEDGETVPEQWRVFVVRPVVQTVYLAKACGDPVDERQKEDAPLNRQRG